MGISEIQALKKLSPQQVYKGKEPTERVKAMLKPKEKKPIPKQSAKKKAMAQEEKDLAAADKEFYHSIWIASPHKCQCGCNASLGKEPLTTMFHHVLFKAQYPALRHEPANVMLLHPKCHTAYHNNPDSRPAIKKRQFELLKQFGL